MEKITHDEYFSYTLKRYAISQVGCLTPRMIPYVRLGNGLIFHGAPAQQAQQATVNMVMGVIGVIKDVEFRYFQVNRSRTQHSHYVYKAGDVVVEIGAYLGYYAMHVAGYIGSGGKLLAIELMPQNHEILQMNLNANFPRNTIALNMGVFNRKGTQTAYFAGFQVAALREDVVGKFVEKPQAMEVETDTVDNILRDHRIDSVDMMIIQVNGNEREVIEGMSASLGRVANLAIAVPYSEKLGTGQIAGLVSLLEERRFAVTLEGDWLYAKRNR